MDGRTQIPAIEYLKKKFNVDHVDSVTEAGPVKILADQPHHSRRCQAIFDRVDISVEKHGSIGIAIVAHHDCAGGLLDDDSQKQQLKDSIKNVSAKYPNTPVIGLWIDSDWAVSQIAE